MSQDVFNVFKRFLKIARYFIDTKEEEIEKDFLGDPFWRTRELSRKIVGL